MGNRLDNLGDYNIVRDALHDHGGNAKSLFKDIGDVAIAEARPAIMKEGITIGVLVGGATVGAISLGIYGAVKGIEYFKQRKEDEKVIQSKDEVKQKYDETVAEIIKDQISTGTES